MDYEKIYHRLVENAKSRGLDKTAVDGYFEKHHIVPRCRGGDDSTSNLVLFTAREHYVAHILLWKIYPEDKNLFHAAWMMSNRTLQKRDSRLYALLKEQHAKILSSRSEFNSPNFKDLTGNTNGKLTVIEFAGWTEQAKGKRTSLWSCQCSCGEMVVLRARCLGGKNPNKSCGCLAAEIAAERTGDKNSFFGKKHSEEARKKMRMKKIGRVGNNKDKKMSEETKAKISATKKANPYKWAEERRLKQSERMRGISTRGSGWKATPEQRLKQSEGLKALDRRAWDTPQVKKSEQALQMWAMSDFYYSVWIEAGKPAIRKFVAFYNKMFDDDITTGAFNKLLLRFKAGWVPVGDSKWETFSREYLGEMGFEDKGNYWPQ